MQWRRQVFFTRIFAQKAMFPFQLFLELAVGVCKVVGLLELSEEQNKVFTHFKRIILVYFAGSISSSIFNGEVSNAQTPHDYAIKRKYDLCRNRVLKPRA